jgi:hypothetical protein
LIQLTHPILLSPRLVQEKENKIGREGTPTLPFQESPDSNSGSCNSDNDDAINTVQLEESMRVARPDFCAWQKMLERGLTLMSFCANNADGAG